MVRKNLLYTTTFRHEPDHGLLSGSGRNVRGRVRAGRLGASVELVILALVQRSKHQPACLIAILVLGAANGLANDERSDRQTLRGITSVAVVVEDLPSEAVKDGLTRDQLQTDVEINLRKAGITILESSGIHHTPFLYVNAHLIKGSGPSAQLYVFDCQVQLVQPVRIVSNGAYDLAPTWSDEITGGTGASDMRTYIRSHIADLVDKFINAYLSVNPKSER